MLPTARIKIAEFSHMSREFVPLRRALGEYIAANGNNCPMSPIANSLPAGQSGICLVGGNMSGSILGGRPVGAAIWRLGADTEEGNNRGWHGASWDIDKEESRTSRAANPLQKASQEKGGAKDRSGLSPLQVASADWMSCGKMDSAH